MLICGYNIKARVRKKLVDIKQVGKTAIFNSAKELIKSSLCCKSVNNNSTKLTSHLLTFCSPDQSNFPVVTTKTELDSTIRKV